MYLVPGDPAHSILGSGAEPWEYEELREKMGLNDPYIMQLVRYIKQVYIDFNLGNSYLTGVSVSGELFYRLPKTLTLSFIGMFVSISVGIPMGVSSAVHRGTWRDYVPLTIALFGVSMPGFWFALMLVLLFSVKLGWLPPYGLGGD